MGRRRALPPPAPARCRRGVTTAGAGGERRRRRADGPAAGARCGVGLRPLRLGRRDRDGAQQGGLRARRAAAHGLRRGRDPDLTTTMLGRPAASPSSSRRPGTPGSATTRECAVAAAAADAGCPTRCRPTRRPRSPTWRPRRRRAQLVPALPHARPRVSLAHLEQAREHGYEAVMLTVDTVVTGMKRKDRRNGFAIPPELTPRTLAGLARHPGGSAASSRASRCASRPSRGSEHARWGVSNALREQAIRPRTSPGSGALRPAGRRQGVLTTQDARVAVDAGPTRSCSPTTADVSSTARPCRSSCCRRSSTRSATAPRSTSTPGALRR